MVSPLFRVRRSARKGNTIIGNEGPSSGRKCGCAPAAAMEFELNISTCILWVDKVASLLSRVIAQTNVV